MAGIVSDWNLSPVMLIVALMLLYLILGTALEGFSMIATTLPVVLPIVEAAGFDDEGWLRIDSAKALALGLILLVVARVMAWGAEVHDDASQFV